MSNNDECVHELPREQCGYCTPPKPEPTAATVDDVLGSPRILSIPAAFDSRCPGCGDDILAGDPIRRSGAGWVCEGCAS